MQVTVGKKVLVTCAIGSYYLISADTFTCPECGAEVIAAWADRPYRMEWQELKVEEADADLVVDLEPNKFRTPYHVRRAHTRDAMSGTETGRVPRLPNRTTPEDPNK